MSAEGWSKASIMRVNDASTATVDRWAERVSDHASHFIELALREVWTNEPRIDELRGLVERKEHRQQLLVTLKAGVRLWLPWLVISKANQTSRRDREFVLGNR